LGLAPFARTCCCIIVVVIVIIILFVCPSIHGNLP
jgi:hypothetical protein